MTRRRSNYQQNSNGRHQPPGRPNFEPSLAASRKVVFKHLRDLYRQLHPDDDQRAAFGELATFIPPEFSAWLQIPREPTSSSRSRSNNQRPTSRDRLDERDQSSARAHGLSPLLTPGKDGASSSRQKGENSGQSSRKRPKVDSSEDPEEDTDYKPEDIFTPSELAAYRTYAANIRQKGREIREIKDTRKNWIKLAVTNRTLATITRDQCRLAASLTRDGAVHNFPAVIPNAVSLCASTVIAECPELASHLEQHQRASGLVVIDPSKPHGVQLMRDTLKIIASNDKKKVAGLPPSLIVDQVAARVDDLDRTPRSIQELFTLVLEQLATELDDQVPVPDNESYTSHRCQLEEWLKSQEELALLAEADWRSTLILIYRTLPRHHGITPFLPQQVPCGDVPAGEDFDDIADQSETSA